MRRERSGVISLSPSDTCQVRATISSYVNIMLIPVDDEMDDKSLREASVLDFERDSFTPNVNSLNSLYQHHPTYCITGFSPPVRLI